MVTLLINKKYIVSKYGYQFDDFTCRKVSIMEIFYSFHEHIDQARTDKMESKCHDISSTMMRTETYLLQKSLMNFEVL